MPELFSKNLLPPPTFCWLWSVMRIRIRDPVLFNLRDPDLIFEFYGFKILNSLRRMRIRDKHPGSAKLVVTRQNCQPEQNIFNQIPHAKQKSWVTNSRILPEYPVSRKKPTIVFKIRIRTENIWDRLRNGKPKIIRRNGLWIHNSVLTNTHSCIP